MASLAGVALALLGASQVTGHTVLLRKLRFPANGKPAFEGGPHFSISHADRHVACLVSDEVDPGLDLEARSRNIDAERLDQWCRSEAALKAAGRGVRDLDRVVHTAKDASASVDGRNYVLAAITEIAGHVCYAALSRPCEIIVQQHDLAAPVLLAAVERSLGGAA
jgi:phosphopantetheinyl transferase